MVTLVTCNFVVWVVLDKRLLSSLMNVHVRQLLCVLCLLHDHYCFPGDEFWEMQPVQPVHLQSLVFLYRPTDSNQYYSFSAVRSESLLLEILLSTSELGCSVSLYPVCGCLLVVSCHYVSSNLFAVSGCFPSEGVSLKE